jgi:hypothetical protein
MFSHLNPDVLVTRSSYEPGYNRNPEVTSVVTERRINPFSDHMYNMWLAWFAWLAWHGMA